MAASCAQAPDPAGCSDEQWTDHVFNRSGVSGVKREWWCHIPSGTWFIAERETASDRILRTYLYSASGASR